MPYNFDFDLSKISPSLFSEMAIICTKRAPYLVKKYHIPKITGLSFTQAQKIVEDLIKINIENHKNKERFAKTKRRALFLPHCARKYMDTRCQARFDPQVPSYFCNHCSSDCLINQATNLAKKKNYDVYVIAGGSCLPKILKNNPYDGVVGVACHEEINLGNNLLKNVNISSQGIPLVKNGCVNTKFSMKNLQSIIES